MKKNLVQIIKDNPGCVAIIDNDCWSLHIKEIASDEEYDNIDFVNANILADSDDDIIFLGDGYGSGNCYGGDILQALAKIVGITVRSV